MEQREQTTITDPATGQSETTLSLIELEQTNLWGGGSSEFPTFTVIASVGIAGGLVGAFLFFIRKRERAEGL